MSTLQGYPDRCSVKCDGVNAVCVCAWKSPVVHRYSPFFVWSKRRRSQNIRYKHGYVGSFFLSLFVLRSKTRKNVVYVYRFTGSPPPHFFFGVLQKHKQKAKQISSVYLASERKLEILRYSGRKSAIFWYTGRKSEILRYGDTYIGDFVCICVYFAASR